MTGKRDEIEVDIFAGGGASLGIERVTGRPVAVAINHDPAAAGCGGTTGDDKFEEGEAD